MVSSNAKSSLTTGLKKSNKIIYNFIKENRKVLFFSYFELTRTYDKILNYEEKYYI